jgi:hypothetical protein
MSYTRSLLWGAYYLHRIVEHDGILWAENLIRTPAAPAASGVWHEEGFKVPLRAMDPASFYKLRSRSL